jgi:hypothetical protein
MREVAKITDHAKGALELHQVQRDSRRTVLQLAAHIVDRRTGDQAETLVGDGEAEDRDCVVRISYRVREEVAVHVHVRVHLPVQASVRKHRRHLGDGALKHERTVHRVSEALRHASGGRPPLPVRGAQRVHLAHRGVAVVVAEETHHLVLLGSVVVRQASAGEAVVAALPREAPELPRAGVAHPVGDGPGVRQQHEAVARFAGNEQGAGAQAVDGEEQISAPSPPPWRQE